MPFAYDWSLVGIDLAIALLTVSALVSAYRIVAVSYTHLTLPTKRIV